MPLSFKKILWIEILLVCLVIATYFFSDIVSFLKKLQTVEYTPSNGCELNKEECSLTLKDGSILRVSAEPKTILPLQSAKFTARIDGAESARAVFKGLNMNMGIHEKTFVKRSDGAFEFSAMLPSCSADMKWQMDVIATKNGKEYGGSFIVWSKQKL